MADGDRADRSRRLNSYSVFARFNPIPHLRSLRRLFTGKTRDASDTEDDILDGGSPKPVPSRKGKDKSENKVLCVGQLHDVNKEKIVWRCNGSGIHCFCGECIDWIFHHFLQSKRPMTGCPWCKTQVIGETQSSGETSGRWYRSIPFPEGEVEEYEAIMLEQTTKNPIYCSERTCSAFIPPSQIQGDVATCYKCGGNTQTCRLCKKAVHPHRPCPKEEDEDTQALLELAKKNNWKSCPGCNHLVEHTKEGCDQIPCVRCNTVFCYHCGKRWQECDRGL
ncbi:hypothetical protein QBC46DRAFT_430618 [Diplogelasinospora grovesii]|uniref:RBR-type E3 ubiquitin transferase n=1 Tax=Diplogelasinospora grovesii TaxID=303347 RepID=A0AAN6RZ75_9PEZI|nr:hypothetical protein QBC46DRAFT_430618 [Diplogelasinospora grovesii]